MAVPGWCLPAAAAPFAGSLLGVLARRLPAGRPVVLARSACDSCHAMLGAGELVPLLSYLWQRGRCRHCGAPIGLFHPLMELGCVAVALVGGAGFRWRGAVGILRARVDAAGAARRARDRTARTAIRSASGPGELVGVAAPALN